MILTFSDIPHLLTLNYKLCIQKPESILNKNNIDLITQRKIAYAKFTE